jgi:hypothetical protein
MSLLGWSMIRKSGYRFSERIMLDQNAGATIDSVSSNFALASPDTSGQQRRPWIFDRLQKEPLEIGRIVPLLLLPLGPHGHNGVAALPRAVAPFAEQAAPVGNEPDSATAIRV